MSRSPATISFLILLVCSSALVHVLSVSVDDYDEQYWEEMQQLTNDSDYGVTWIYMPDGYGIPRVALLTEPEQNSRLAVARGSVNFYLYTSNGDRQGKDLDTIQASKDEFTEFDPSKETIFLIHGWRASEGVGGIYSIREAFMRGESRSKVNLITVDWEDLASNLYYFESARRTNDVGRTTAELIDFMVSNMSLSLDRVHLIGHSLGAHTAGFVGSHVKSGKVGRITGLDPAGPGFYRKGPEGRLDPTDAAFVDVIHTAVGSAGHYKNLGHVDFYPNGGIFQPGCGYAIILKESCSHSKSQDYYVDSMKNNNFYGYKCRSFPNLKSGNCDTSEYVMMGHYIDMKSRGKYYVEVDSQSPYGKGPKEKCDE